MGKQCRDCVYLDLEKKIRYQYECKAGEKPQYPESDYAENCKKFKEKPYQAVGIDCFITTALVHILKMDDKCIELETLRAFRHNYMQKRPECADMLKQYDTVGPIIAKVLYSLPKDVQYNEASHIFKVYIKGSVNYIAKGKYEEAVELYSMMTNTLVRKYLFSYTVGEELWNKIDSSNAGHGKIKL